MFGQERMMSLIKQFMRVANKLNADGRKPLDFGTGCLLHRAEIHTIEAIGNKSGINVTELAQGMGVTKGAISQMVDKLMSKDMVGKVSVLTSINEVSLTLTEKGMLAYQNHCGYHAAMYAEISDLMAGYSQEKIDLVANALAAIEGILDKHIED
jgi:DNA-binding MarR family transcriptional regulator